MMATPQPAPPNFAQGSADASAAAAAKYNSGGDATLRFNPKTGQPVDPVAIAQDSGWTPAYGGYAGGANDFYNYTKGLGAAAANQAAPQMDMGAANADRVHGLAALQQQQAGLGALAQQGAGGGPGATAAQAGFNANANTGMLAALQASGGGKGASGVAAAQQQALAGNAGAMNAGAAQAAGQRASYAQQGMAAFQQGAQGYSQGAAGLSTADWNAAGQQAQLQENQNSINQAGQLGFQGLGQAAVGTEGNIAAGVYAANLGNTTAANALAQQQAAANWTMGLGAISSGASALSKFGNGTGSNTGNASGSGGTS